jgi:alkylation response protein AidB-like acyl-CoA dehydrogenase
MIQQSQLEKSVERVVRVAAENAIAVDASGTFPRRAIDALASEGLLGLTSATAVGGSGQGLRAAANVVERLAGSCASTAMVTMMHYCAVAVIEAHAPVEVRREVATGRKLGTLAFSEAGSRSHFWAPLSTATANGDRVLLEADKSWVTSAGEADLYIWSSRPMAAEGASSLWLVPARTVGVEVGANFNGLGMRGNASRPMTARRAAVPASAELGPDGGGFDIMMGVVLPWFQVLNSAASIGIAEAAVEKTAAHAGKARFEHLNQTLADQPVNRYHIARMRIQTDQAKTLLLDTITAIESSRPDTMLRVLEAKASASEAAVAVTDLAMRVCGGAAFRKEVGVERNFRDARAATVMAPTTDALYDFIGKAVCGLPLF